MDNTAQRARVIMGHFRGLPDIGVFMGTSCFQPPVIQRIPSLPKSLGNAKNTVQNIYTEDYWGIYIYIASIEWSLHRYEQQLWRFGFPQLHDQLPWFSSLLVYSCELCIRSFMMNHWNCFLGTLQPFVGSRFVRPPMLPRSLFCKAPWYGEVVGSWWMSYLNPHKVLVATCWDVKVRKELRHHLLQFLEDLFKDIFLAFSCYTYHCSTKATCDAVMHMPRRR